MNWNYRYSPLGSALNHTLGSVLNHALVLAWLCLFPSAAVWGLPLAQSQGSAPTVPTTDNVSDSEQELREVLRLLKESLSVLQVAGSRENYATGLISVAELLVQLEDYPEAVEAYEQAIAIQQELQQTQAVARNLNDLALLYNILGFYSQSLDALMQSLALNQKLGNRPGESSNLNNLGQLYSDFGQYEKALTFYQRSLDILYSLNQPDAILPQQFNNIARMYQELGDYQKAQDFYQESLKRARAQDDRRGEGIILSNIAGVYDIQKQPEKALELYQQALAIQREQSLRGEEGTVLNNIGSVYHGLKRYSQALSFYQQALQAYQKSSNKPGEGTAWRNIGVIQLRLKQYALAEGSFQRAIAIMESLRPGLADGDRISLTDTQLDSYRLLQEVLVAQGKPEQALEISERGRARAFVELLATKFRVPGSKVQAASNAANSLYLKPINIAEIKQVAKEQNATLVQYSVLFDGTTEKPNPTIPDLLIWVVTPSGTVTLRQVNLQASLLTNTSLADLVATVREEVTDGSRGLIQTPNQLQSSQLQPSQPQSAIPSQRLVFEENPQWVKQAIEQIQEDAREESSLQQLHRVLIDPIADLLPKNPSDRIIFIPQSQLFLVPFPALQNSNGNYLVETHTITTAPAIQVLQLTRQQQLRMGGGGKVWDVEEANRLPTLIVGNPTMPQIAFRLGDKPEPLSTLPGAEKEARTIAALLQTQALIGNQATKSEVLQRFSRARLIHLATHGLLNDFDGQGVPGAIALAPDPSASTPSSSPPIPPGLLTAREILDLTLSAELVTLSACDTGRGKITGDGVIGLSRSLIAAGAPSVIVSLWKVPDDSTVLLMTEFYRNLQQGRTKAQALRQAMLTTKAQYPDPVDWAAFTLIGEGE